MRIHSAIVLVYGLLLITIAGVTAALAGLDESLDRWIVIGTGAGGLFALLDFFASRVVFRRVLPMFGVRSARIVLIFYTGLLSWLLWRSLTGLGTEGHELYQTVVVSAALVLTLGVTVCEFLLDRTGREFKKLPGGESPKREAVRTGKP